MRKIPPLILALVLLVINASAQQHAWHVYVDSAAQGAMGAHSFVFDRAGNTWVLFINTDSVGVGRFDGVRWTHFGTSDGLPGGRAYSIITDHDGNIWISADSGIAEFKGGAWRSYRIEDKLTGVRSYRALAADSNGNIWVATFSTIFIANIPGGTYDSLWNEFYRFNGDGWTSYTPPYAFNWAGFNDVAIARDGTVWGTGIDAIDSAHDAFQYGLMHFDGSAWQRFLIEPGTGIFPQSVAGGKTIIEGEALHPDPNGGIWVAIGSTGSTVSSAIAICHFNGSSWDTTGLSGRRFCDMWIAPNGEKYFRSNVRNQYGNPTNSGALVIVNTHQSIDSIPQTEMPFFPFYSIQFMPDGTPWFYAPYTTSGLGAWFEIMSVSSGVASNSSPDQLSIIYPNPASNVLHVTGANDAISIVDPLGRVLDLPREGKSFDVSKLPSGIYFLRNAFGLRSFAVER